MKRMIHLKEVLGRFIKVLQEKTYIPQWKKKLQTYCVFVTKNHSFSDGNKRIAATMFLYFLDKNGVLLKNGEKLIDDHTLVALTIMIAESNPEEKEMMISVIMNCIK